MTALVSIIVPVFNVEKYIGACLDSLCRQTFSNIEIICVEDGSTDDSLARITGVATQDPRVSILRHPANRGLSAARNTGLRAAQSPWILFIDSDDIVSSYLCERTLDAAKKHSADAVFFSHAVFRDGEPAPPEPDATASASADRRALLSRPAFAWTKLVRTDLMRSNEIEFPDGLCFEDTPVHWRLALESRCPVLLDEPLVWYRQRAGSITYRADWSRADSLASFDLIRNYLHHTGRWQEWKDLFLVQELANLAHIHAYYLLKSRSLTRRVYLETKARMTSEHWRFVLHGNGLLRWERDYLISCGLPTGRCTDPKLLLPLFRHRVRDPLRCLWHRLRMAYIL